MPGDIDTASVLITPNFSRFEGETERGIDNAFGGLEPTVRELVASIERIFADLADELRISFEDIKSYADTAFDRMATSAEDTGVRIHEDLQRGVDSAERAFDELRIHAKEDLDQVSNHAKAAGEKTGSSLRNFVGGAALLGGITAAGAGLEQLTSFGLKSAGQIEQLKISFDQLTGSAAAGEQQFKDLENFAAATPFEMQDVTVAAQRFDAFSKSVGMSQQQLIPFLTTVGNVVSVTGGGAQAFDSVSLAMGQIASRGKLTLDNLNQLSNALPGFSGALAIANATGKTQAQVMDEISAGQISAADGIKYLLQGMQQFPGAAGAMEKQSQTLVGVFSTFHDVVGMSLSQSFASSIPAIKNTLTSITPIIGDALNQVAPMIGGVLTSLMTLGGPLIKNLAGILAPLLDGLAQGLKLIGPALDPIGQALGNLASALGPVLTMAGQLIAALGPALGPIIQALVPLISGLMDGLQPVIDALLPIIVQLGQTIGAILLPVMVTLGKIFGMIGPPLGELIKALGAMFAPLLRILAPLIQIILNALSPLWPVLVQLIQPLIQLTVALTPLIVLAAQLLTVAVQLAAPILKLAATLLAFLTAKAVVPMMMSVVNAMSGLFKWLMPVANWLGKVATWLGKLQWGKIGSEIAGAFSHAWQAVENFFSTLGSKIGGWLAQAGHAILSFFTSLPGWIWNAIMAVPGLIERGVSMWFHGTMYLIGFAIGSIIRLFMTLPGMIWNIITTLFTTAWNLFTTGLDIIVGFVMSLPQRIWNIFIALKNGAVAIITGFINGVIWIFSVLPGRVVDFVVSMWNSVKAWFTNGVNTVVNWLRGLPGKASNAVSNLWSSIKSGIGDIVGNFTSLGKQIINGLIDGVKSAIGGAIDVVTSGMKDIYNGALKALGVHSPSRLFSYIGEMSMAGFAQGVDNRKVQVTNTVLGTIAPPRMSQIHQTAATGGAAMPVFGPGSIVINFGGVPSQSEARTAGQLVGQGIIETLTSLRQSTSLKAV